MDHMNPNTILPSPRYPSEDQPKSQLDPSLRPSPSILIPDSNPEGSGGNYRVIIQVKEIKDLKAYIKKLKKKAKLVITHHKAWMQSVSIKTRLAGKKSMQKKWMQKESVSKQGRKTVKSKPTAHKDQAFDDPDDFGPIDYMETEDAHNENEVSTEDQVNTVKPDEGTDKPKVSTNKIDEGTIELKNGNSDENATPTATLTVFGDDETIAEFLHLPKIDPKDKGKKVLKEEAKSDAESKGVNEAERKFAQLANDEEIARKVQEEWETEEKNKKLAEEEATKRRIKDVNKKSTSIKKDDSIKEESKEKESTRKRKLGTRKKMKSRKRRFRQDTSQDDQTDSEKGNRRKVLVVPVIIMAQQQHAVDVHPDKLCPPNKRYDLMDANKKVDLEHHTLKEDGSKYRLRFMLDKKEISLTLDDFRTIFHLPQANDNNHNLFVPPPSFSDIVLFYKQQLGFTMELKTSIGSIAIANNANDVFFINNIHVDYAELLWEGIYYSLHHPTSSILYPRFAKIIVSHYMTIFPEISRRARDMYYNLQDDDIMKNILNTGRHKDKVGMQIPDWKITKEMKHTEHYRMYAEVFGLDVPLNQSQPTESTQGTHRTPSAPRSPTPKKDTTELSAPKRSTMICFCLPERRSTGLTPPVPVPTVEKADEMILQDTLQIEKLVEGSENVIDDSLPPRNDEPLIPVTRLEPRSDKESPEVDKTNDAEVEVTKVFIPINVNEEDDEITNEVYELKLREKGKIVEESRSTPLPTLIRSSRSHTNLVSLDTEKLQITKRLHSLLTKRLLKPESTSIFVHDKLLSSNARQERLQSDRMLWLPCFSSTGLGFIQEKSIRYTTDNLHEVMVETLTHR
ncbi:hypothetical protein Tco_0709726 [Tanacetum coccineum]